MVFKAKASGLRGQSQWSSRPRTEVFKANDGGLRGQGQRSSRQRAVVFEAKAKAKDLEAEVEASDLCDEG